VRALKSNWKALYSPPVIRFGWSARSAGAAPRTRSRWSLRTVLMAAYFLCVIAPIALLAVGLGALLAGLVLLGNKLHGQSKESTPIPLAPCLTMLECSSESLGSSVASRGRGGGVHPFVD
jgi:hypothetical protein